MDPNLEKRLSAIETKLDDTFKMVRKMRRAQQTAAAMKLLYWAVIIILGFVAVEALKPYLEELKNAYGNVSETTKGYSDLLKSL